MIGSVSLSLERSRFELGFIILALATTSIIQFPVCAQERDNRESEWRYIGGDASHTRYSPLDHITADNGPPNARHTRCHRSR